MAKWVRQMAFLLGYIKSMIQKPLIRRLAEMQADNKRK